MEEILYTGFDNAIIASVLALFVFVVARAVRAPALSRALWLLVLAKLITPPLVEVELPQWPLATVSSSPEPDFEKKHTESYRYEAPVTLEPTHRALVVEVGESRGIEVPSASADWPRWIACVWAAGTVALVFRLLYLTSRFQLLLKTADEAPEDVESLIRELAERLGINDTPKVRIVDARISPFVWCFGARPVLVLSRNVLRDLSRHRLSLVLAHELSHVRRRDHLLRLLEALPVFLYWWLPVAWFARRELRAAEEQCADASVLELFPSSGSTYVETLVAVVDLRSKPHRPGFALGLNESSLTRRCKMILQEERTRSQLGPFVRLCVGCTAFLVLPLSTEVVGQESSAREALSDELPSAPQVVPSDENASDESFVPLVKESRETLVPLGEEFVNLGETLVPLVKDGFVFFMGGQPDTREPEEDSLENRVRRLEKLVERLVTSIESQRDAQATQKRVARHTGQPPATEAPQRTRRDPEGLGVGPKSSRYRERLGVYPQDRAQQILHQVQAIDEQMAKLRMERDSLLGKLRELRPNEYPRSGTYLIDPSKSRN